MGKNGDFVHHTTFTHVTVYAAFIPWSTVEILQFYFHNAPEIQQHFHDFIYLVNLTVAVVLMIEAWMKNSFLLILARLFLILLEGTWFFQIAHSIYGAQPWTNNHTNQTFIIILFIWHSIGLLVFVTVSMVIVSCKVRGCRFRRDERLGIELKNVGDDKAER